MKKDRPIFDGQQISKGKRRKNPQNKSIKNNNRPIFDGQQISKGKRRKI